MALVPLPVSSGGETLEKRDAVRVWPKEHGYRVAQVTLDFEDYAWNAPYAKCVAKNDQQAMVWLKSSYLDTAAVHRNRSEDVTDLAGTRHKARDAGSTSAAFEP